VPRFVYSEPVAIGEPLNYCHFALGVEFHYAMPRIDEVYVPASIDDNPRRRVTRNMPEEKAQFNKQYLSD
jgi:hypothetical protein